MFLHPYQTKALRGETANTGYAQAQRDANIRGESNPIFSGALGIWDGVILHEYEKITTRLGAAGTDPSEYWEATGDTAGTAPDVCTDTYTCARALFCGAQAAVIGYGQYPGWYEKNFDYGRVPGVATDIVYGIKKTQFNSKDFGVIAVDTTYAVD
jgi:N4-gp56 family major capsid protein